MFFNVLFQSVFGNYVYSPKFIYLEIDVLIFHKLCEMCSPEMDSCNELEVSDFVIDNRLVILV